MPAKRPLTSSSNDHPRETAFAIAPIIPINRSTGNSDEINDIAEDVSTVDGCVTVLVL